MHSIDLVNMAMSKLKELGVELRLVRGDGLSSNLCRLGARQILFLNDATTAQEQLDIFANAFHKLNVPLESLPTPLAIEMQRRQAFVSLNSAAA